MQRFLFWELKKGSRRRKRGSKVKHQGRAGVGDLSREQEGSEGRKGDLGFSCSAVQLLEPKAAPGLDTDFGEMFSFAVTWGADSSQVHPKDE